MTEEQTQTDQTAPPVAEEPKVPVPSVTDEQIQEIALGIHRHQIYTDRHIPQAEWDHMAPRVFLPILLGGFGNIDTSTIGLVWEHLDKAGPRSINGRPQFFSFNTLNLADAEKAMAICRRLRDAEQAVIGTTSGK